MMIKLNKLLLVFWQGYEKQVIHFDEITLLTGMTGSGKSTIMDALNVIFLGEKHKRIFNKAANENSDRTIESYLFGRLGDDGEEGFHFLRDSNFTSVIAAEFIEVKNNIAFTCGLIADCDENPNYTPHWFIKETTLEEHFFIDEASYLPRSYAELLSLNSTVEQPEKIKFFGTDTEYRAMSAARFGQLRNDFRRLLKQSMTFNPVKDIGNFLTEFVSEQENKVKVDDMQTSIRYYNELVYQTEQIKNKIIDLQEIVSRDEAYARSKYVVSQQEFVIEKARLDAVLDKENKLKNELKANQQKLVELNDTLALQIAEKKVCDLRSNELINERGKLDALQQKILKEEQLKYSQVNLRQVESSTINARKKLSEFISNLQSVGNHADVELTNKNSEVISQLNELNKELKRQLKHATHQIWLLEAKETALTEAITIQKKEIELLVKGIKPMPDKEEHFRMGLEQYLSKTFGSAKITYLFEEIEFVSGESSWHKAIETYINQQKNYLIVEPEMYTEALVYYESLQSKQEMTEIGIINLKKVNETIYLARKNSLATKVTARRELAQNYLNYLLGNVIACETVNELENYPVAITSNGFLYQSFAVRKLRFASKYFIGRNSLKEQLKEAKEKLQLLHEQEANYKSQKNMLAFVNAIEFLNDDSIALIQTYGDGQELTKMSRQNKRLAEELETFDDHEINEMDKKIAKNDAKKESISQEILQIKTEISNLTEKNKKIESSEIITVITAIEAQEIRFNDLYQNHTNRTEFENFYARDLSTRGEAVDFDKIVENFTNNLQQTRKNVENRKQEVISNVSEFNGRYVLDQLPINPDQNNIYKDRLQIFRDSDLPKKEDEISEALVQAHQIFRYDFLGKIRGNIESLHRQVDEINRALKGRKFGEDEYKFQVKPQIKTERFYNMIMDELLINQDDFNLFSDSFESKYKNEIEKLFAVLAGLEIESTTGKENQIEFFSDYRSYLKFDILVIKENEKTQRLSKTYGSKSGGETQIPLYIALLAAFSSVYRVSDRRNSDTLRLVLMDEAFSKIDGEKIKQCIDLVREFKLQAIFSTPPEKIPEIMEKADKAIVVFRDKNTIEIHEFASIKDIEGDQNGLRNVFTE